MPDDPRDDLEPRVSALEREMAQVRADAAAARVLAAGADRDVSEVRAELRAHLQAINALGAAQRETRLELKAEIAELRSEIGSVRSELRSEIGSVRSEMRNGFAMMSVGMAQIVELLERPEG